MPPPPPTNVQVIAPATLSGGYAFDATYDGITFKVVVPEGGVTRGQRFIVPFVPSAPAYSSDDGYEYDDEDGRRRIRRGRRRRSRGGTGRDDGQEAIPRGIWRDGLCDCFRHGPFHPHFILSLFFRPLLLGQLLTRMRMTYVGRRGALPHRYDPNDSRIEDANDDRWRYAIRDVLLITGMYVALAFVTSPSSSVANDRHDDDEYDENVDDDGGDGTTSSSSWGGIDGFKYAINSLASVAYVMYTVHVTSQLRAVMRRAYSIPEEQCLCVYELCPGGGNDDPRQGICGSGGGGSRDDEDENDIGNGGRWCASSGVPVGWEDVCCSIWCQTCVLGQMARHTVDYDGRDAAWCNATGVSDWDDEEAYYYAGAEYGRVGEGSVLVV
jgi:hypothetical protein